MDKHMNEAINKFVVVNVQPHPIMMVIRSHFNYPWPPFIDLSFSKIKLQRDGQKNKTKKEVG